MLFNPHALHPHTFSSIYLSFTYLSSIRLHPLTFHPHTLSFHTLSFPTHTLGFPSTHFFNSVGTFSFHMPFTPSSTHFLNLYIPVLHIAFIHIPYLLHTLPFLQHFFHSHTFHLCISFHPYFRPTPTIPACCMHHMSPRFFTNEPTPSLTLS